MYKKLALIGIGIAAAIFIALQLNSSHQNDNLAASASSSARVSEHTLQNGMKILVQTDNRSPVVISQVWYKVGSSYEYNGITGISHMLEHMMFKGTKDLKPGEFSEIIASNGGRENAFTSRDYTAYFQTIASDRLELCLRLEADRMRNVIFDQNEFLKERDVVAEERRLRTDDKPRGLTYELFNATAFASSPYHHPVIGWMQDINNYAVEDALNWYNKWYAPNNATLVVIGDVKAEDVFALAEKYFGPIQPEQIPAPKPQLEIPQLGKRRVELETQTQVPFLIMGYKTPTLKTVANPEEAYALEVLAGILDGGDSARLSRNLVRGKQLAASAGASYDLYSRMDGLFTLRAVPVSTTNTNELEYALLQEINQLKEKPVTKEELERIKAQVIASDVYERDSMFYQAMKLGILETIGLDWRKVDQYVEGVKAVTAEQIQAAAKKYLVNKQLTVAELVPQTAIQNTEVTQ